jgi:Tfp pilus assembly protein PilF
MGRRSGPEWPHVLLIFCLFLSTAGWSQTAGDTGTRGSYSLSGYVRDEDTRESLQSAVVALTQESGNAAAPTVHSGTTGEFLFMGLNSGEYHVSAKFAGYEPASTVVTLGGTSLLTIELALHKSNTASPMAGGDPISAHELTIPFNARDDYDKGVKLLTLAKPNYERAIWQFQRAIKEFATYYEAYAEMSIAYYHVGQAPAAEQALRTSVSQSKSQYLDALLLLSEMLDDQNRFTEAEPLARQAVTIQDNSSRGQLALARALAGLKRPNEAEVSALKASELNPSNAQVFLVLGNIHIQQHKYAVVMKDFDNYLRINPTGTESDAVRATQEQVKKALQRSQPKPS